MASDAKACFSFKVEYRTVIRYLYLKGKTGKEIQGELADVYGSSAPSYAQVKFWVGEFKRGRTSLEDEARSGRPLDATDEEMCKKVRGLVYSDRRIQVEEIAQAFGISHGSVSTILHDRLGMRKLTTRWVLKSLSDDFFFDLGFTALSRIFHLYRADRSSKVGENRRTRRKTT